MVEIYDKKEKMFLIDREDLLLKLILKSNIKSTTYSQLSNEMKDLGHEEYGWQTARVDLKKLGIIKWTNRNKKPIVIYIDLIKAQKRADERNIHKKHHQFDKNLIEDDLASYAYSDFVSMDDIKELNGYEFEYFLKILFQKMGYEVQTTKLAGDQGADLIIKRLNSKISIAVQAKNHVGKVTNRAVQEVVASITYYGANRGLVITNSFFTKSAIELAEVNNVDLIDGHKLERLLKEYPISKRNL